MKSISNSNQQRFLETQMEGVKTLLLQRGYSPNTVCTYQATWNKLKKYSTSPYYSKEVNNRFLYDCWKIEISNPFQKLTRQMRSAVRAIALLDDYYQTGDIDRRYTRITRLTWLHIHEEFFKEYFDYCMNSEHSETWIKSVQYQLGLFSHYLMTENIFVFQEIQYSHLEGYVVSLKDYAPKTKALRLQQLGDFFRYLYTQGYLKEDLSVKLPRVNRNQFRLPQIWSEEQIEKFVKAIDRGSPVGKRDYAMFLLMARLGLRVSDVVGLKFENICWERNSISIYQQKTGEPLKLPISEEIGSAIIDYMKNARPQIDSTHIFLTHLAPFLPLANHNNFHSEFRKYLSRAGIKLPTDRHYGVHSLRHSFATNLLKNKVDLITISEIIGHKSTQTTSTYLKVDIESLRMCSLNPEVSVND